MKRKSMYGYVSPLQAFSVALGIVATTGCAPVDESGGAALGDAPRGPITGAPLRSGDAPPPAAAGADGEHVGSAADAIMSGHGIDYHGGPVMSGTVNIY